MAFEKFLNIASNEYKIFTELSHEIANNFANYHGQNYYFHISKAGENISVIDEVKQFTDLYEFGEYLYIMRDREGCIIMRSDPNSIGLLLNGEFDFAEHTIKPDNIIIAYELTESTLPISRNCKMTSIEIMQAFGLINESLNKVKGQIAS
jgi:hypothetical protein